MELKSRAEGARKKRDKYQDLRAELRRLWDKPVEIVPLIVRVLGTIPKSLKRNLEELGPDVTPGLLQKSVVLETAHIIRRTAVLLVGGNLRRIKDRIPVELQSSVI